MRIAIVGSGISGLTAARALWQRHDVTVFEAEPRVGGHSHTVTVEAGGRPYQVDTGFIVYNDRTYPRFSALLGQIGVPGQRTAMSFSVHCDRSGLEYNGTSIDGLFAQRRNLARPAFWRMLAAISRFNREAAAFAASGDDMTTLGSWLEQGAYPRELIDWYIVPMGSAIWSASPREMLRFPARHFMAFFGNHGLLSLHDRPRWSVIRGGSRTYVERMIEPFRHRIHVATPVVAVYRRGGRILVITGRGDHAWFDHVILAVHSDQALAMLADASAAERALLGAIAYQPNDVTLHTDVRLLPRRRRAWAAWNCHLPAQPADRVQVTYNMNILQSIRAPETFCVTLNRHHAIDPERVLGRFVYHHPVFTSAALEAQRRRHEICGVAGTWFCGAWWGSGFHEDGVVSALDVVRRMSGRASVAA